MKNFQLKSSQPIKGSQNIYSPGQILLFKAKFSSIPDKYRLQIFDGKENARLNHYGKGTPDGINLNWPIPKTVREKHLGLWQISIDTQSENFRLLFEVKDKNNIRPAE